MSNCNDPLFLVTKVSRKAICPLFSVSIVNDIFESIEFKVSWNVEIAFVQFYDHEAIINIPFPDFRRCRCGCDRCFFDYFHTEVNDDWTNRASHCADMDLFEGLVFVVEVVI